MGVLNTELQAAEKMARASELEVKRVMSELIEQKNKLVELKNQVAEQQGRKNVGIKELKKLDPELYRNLARNQKALKTLNRGLGTLITTDPEFLAAYNLLQDIGKLKQNDPEYIQKLQKTLGNWDSNISGYDAGLKKFWRDPKLVGHHPTALSTLRDALADLGSTDEGFQFRRKLLALAKEEGWEIGEEFIKYIDPAAHKAFDKVITGVLGEHLKDLDPNSAEYEALFKVLRDNYAHAWWAGETTGVAVPKSVLNPKSLKNVKNPLRTALKRMEPVLGIDKAGLDRSLTTNDIIKNWSKKVESGAFKNQTDAAIALTQDLSQLTPPEDVPGLWKKAAISSKTAVFDKGQQGIITGSKLGSFDKQWQNRVFNGQFRYAGGDGSLVANWNQLAGLDNLTGITTENLSNVYRGARNRLGIWSLSGGPSKLARGFAQDLGFGTVLGIVFDEKQRERLLNQEYGAFANQAIWDELQGQALWHSGKALLNTPLGVTVSPYIPYVGAFGATAYSANVLKDRSKKAAETIVEREGAKTNKEQAQVLINSPFEMFTRIISPQSFQEPVEEPSNELEPSIP